VCKQLQQKVVANRGKSCQKRARNWQKGAKMWQKTRVLVAGFYLILSDRV